MFNPIGDIIKPIVEPVIAIAKSFVVIGGYESGVDVAYHLALRGKEVRLLDRHNPWESESSDPSIALSTYSYERTRRKVFTEHVQLIPDSPVDSVDLLADSTYEVSAQDGRKLHTTTPPLFAGGFEGSHTLVSDLFEQREDGFPLLNEHDESTLIPGVFLCGAAVRHDNLIFCFIYNFITF